MASLRAFCAFLLVTSQGVSGIPTKIASLEDRQRRLQEATFKWTTEHHDTRNSGNSGEVGPAEATGVCKHTIVKAIASDFGFLTSKFYSTGVTSVGNGWWYGGDNMNNFWFCEDFGNEQWIESTLNLTSYFNVANPATPWGVVSAAVATVSAIDGNNMVIVPSADGHVYAMDVLQCAVELEAAGVDEVSGAPKQPNPVEMVPAPAHVTSTPLLSGSEELRLKITWPRARVEAMEAAASGEGAPRALQPGAGCNVWTASSATNLPFASPVRYLSNPLGDGRNFVLISETNADLATGGVLHMLDASSGGELWNQPAQPPKGGPIYGLVGIVPALVPPANNILLVPFGTTLVALNLNDGTTCDSASTTTGDIFVSSPAVSSDGTGAYIHSSDGTLWRFNLQPGCSPSTLGFGWGCTYDPQSNPPACISAVSEKETVHSKFDPTTGAIISQETIKVSELNVVGAWHQPTTTKERDELWDAIKYAHTTAFGEDHTKNVMESVTSVWPSQINGNVVDLEPLRIAALAKNIPRSSLYSIITPSGYLRLGPNAKPGLTFDLQDFAGVYPYATPALTADDQFIAVANFNVNIDSSVVYATTSSGNGVWGYYSFPTVGGPNIPFGKSRSSPAIDSNGCVYVGSDIDWALSPTLNVTFPVLFALGNDGTLKWASLMGEENVTIGSASPIITDGVDGDHRAYMVSADSVISLTEGASCPSSDVIIPCSGHGTCNCNGPNGGQCSCQGCWYDGANGMCNTYNPNGCGANGACDDSGACDCNLCWTPDPITGSCTTPLDCKNGGTCDGGSGNCQCPSPCFTLGGDGLCSNVFDCGPSGTCSDGGGGQPSCACADTCYSAQPGQPCAPVIDCGPGGTCSNGACDCQPCWGKDSAGSCTVPLDCQNNGVCDSGSGQCICTGCFTQDSNGTCTVPFNCGPGGTCTDDGQPGDPFTCACTNACNSLGPDGTCSLPINCASGICVDGGCQCNACFGQDAGGNCTVPTSCANGQCNAANGMCLCNACWLPDPNSGVCTVPNDCSGNGQCNSDGTCSCLNSCYSDPFCSTVNSCSNHGICDVTTGNCKCASGYSQASNCYSCDGCHYGGGCSLITDHCGGNGVCVVNPDGTEKGCQCNTGWSGASCTTNADNAASGGASPAVAAGVAIPITLLGASAIGIFFFAKMTGTSFSTAAVAAPKALLAKVGIGKGYAPVSGGSGGSGKSGGSSSFSSDGSSAPKSAYAISTTSGAGSSQASSVASRLSGLLQPDAAKTSLLGSSSSKPAVSSSSSGGGLLSGKGGAGGSYGAASGTNPSAGGSYNSGGYSNI